MGSPIMRKVFAVAALTFWEAWWAYEYVSAPDPDVTMQSVGAILFGGGTLVIIALWFAGLWALRGLFRLEK